MAIVNPPQSEVTVDSSFPTQQRESLSIEEYTPKQQETIRKLQELSKEQYPKRLTSLDVRWANKRGKCPNVTSIADLFGGFTKALLAAGLPTIGTPQKAIVLLQALAKELEKTPTTIDVDTANREGKCPSVSRLIDFFGSFTNALLAANLPFPKKPNPLIAIRQLKDLERKLKRIPTSLDVCKASKLQECPSVATYQVYFTTFNNALLAAGMPIAYKGRRSDEFPSYAPQQRQVIAQLRFLARKIKRTPTRIDVSEASKRRECFSVRTVQNQFGESFNNALRAARLPINKRRTAIFAP